MAMMASKNNMVVQKVSLKSLPKSKTIPYRFSTKHIAYIRKCENCTFNVLEGAVRSGKTVDNVFAFAHELKTTPDRIHLATGSTMGNAKLNIGDANGFGLEWIFRGQCRWGRYHDLDALIIQGPYTNFKQKIVIFSGGCNQYSYQKIRGNSYGMWIATEINLHHDNTIKEAFNRQLAAKRRKVFWDLNPDNPKAPIYSEYIDKYARLNEEGKLLGGYNYQHFNIFQNVNLPKERIAEIVSQYEPGSIWYIRDIEGKRSIAEGLIYTKLAALIAANDQKYVITKQAVQQMIKKGTIIELNCGVDFGGNGSGHAFVATAYTLGYEYLIVLRSELYIERQIDPETGEKLQDLDPQDLSRLFLRFVKRILDDYGFITNIYADSAEQVLIRGFRTALIQAKLGQIKVRNALKSSIVGRIRTTTSLAAQGRLLYTEETKSWQDAISMAVWKPKNIELERLDNGTSDIDSLDAFEYTFEHDINKLLRQSLTAGKEVSPGGNNRLDQEADK